jgi:predicted deacetylase
MKSLIVSLHDVAPGSAETSRRWMELFDERNLAVSLLVIPGHWNGTELLADEQFQNWLALNSGSKHEIVLHGLHHQMIEEPRNSSLKSISGRLFARGCQEFWALSKADAKVLINDGLDKLSSLGYKPSGFIAPGWLASTGTKQAISEIGFSYTTSHLLISDLLFEKRHFAPVICQRPNAPTTRVVMLMTTLLAEILMALRLPLRIAVHPEDLHDAKLRKRILKIISRAVVNGYQSITYDQFVSNTHKRNKIPTGLNDSMSFV